MGYLYRVIVATFVCISYPAAADTLEDLFSPWELSMPYFGGGISITHHTGYVPIPPGGAQSWKPGAKAYLGMQFSPVFSGEAAYYYLGDATLKGIAASEESHAVAVSLSVGRTFSTDNPSHAYPALLDPIIRLFDETRIFVTSGIAHKWIDQSGAAGARASEKGFTFLVGVGVQRELPNNSFIRLELEHIGKIGTSTAINVQHTPITLSLGMRF